MQEAMITAVRLRLAEILKKRKMTQRELAEKAGLTTQTISLMASGYPRQIRLETIDAICEALEIEVGDLIVREKPASN